MKEKELKQIGDRIRALRGELTQTAFSDALGIKQAMVSRYEANKEMPSPRVLLRIAQFGGTTIEWLLTGQEPGRKGALKSKGKAKGGQLSRKELIDQAVKSLGQIHLSETETIIALVKDLFEDRNLMLKLIKYYRYLKS